MMRWYCFIALACLLGAGAPRTIEAGGGPAPTVIPGAYRASLPLVVR